MPYGIMDMELYIPYLAINQSDFEKYHSISAGKITVGLG